MPAGDGPARPLGAKTHRRADRTARSSEVRAAERAIEIKRERFAAIYAAGRLCGYLAPGGSPRWPPATTTHTQLEATAARRACTWRSTAARPARPTTRASCATCAARASTQGRRAAARAGASDEQRSAGGPACATGCPTGPRGCSATNPPGRDRATRRRRRPPRLTGAAAVKLATFCTGGAGALGACVATGVLPAQTAARTAVAAQHPDRHARARPRSTPSRTPTARRPGPRRRPRPRRATATPRRKRPASRGRSSTKKTQGGTGPAQPRAAAGVAGARERRARRRERVRPHLSAQRAARARPGPGRARSERVLLDPDDRAQEPHQPCPAPSRCSRAAMLASTPCSSRWPPPCRRAPAPTPSPAPAGTGRRSVTPTVDRDLPRVPGAGRAQHRGARSTPGYVGGRLAL